MKKDEFFKAMKKALSGMDEEISAEILNDYETHFREGMENGKNEEEICEELGNVEEIRQAFLEENPDHTVTKATTDQAKDAAKFPKQVPADLIDGEYHDILSVIMQIISVDIKITKSDTNSVVLSVTGNDAQSVRALKESLHVTDYSNSLRIEQEENVQTDGLQTNELCISIALPRRFLRLCCIKSISGDVAIEDAICRNLDIRTTSGDIRIESCKTETIKVKGVSGDMEIKSCKADRINVLNNSGDIEIKSCKANRIDAASNSGDVKAVFDEKGECSVHSSSGDCSVTIGNHIAARIDTGSGDIEARYLGGKGLAVNISSISGDVSATCGGAYYGGRRTIRASYGEADSSIHAFTVSGDLTVKDC